jgi:hypothetical protein
MALLDIIVCHTTTLGFLFDLLVCRIGVTGDDVPGVDETREEAQAAESDVDERVGRAETALDPYCKLLVTDLSRVAWSMLRGWVAAQLVWRRGVAVGTHQREEGKGWPRSPGRYRCRTCCSFWSLYGVIDGVCARGRGVED